MTIDSLKSSNLGRIACLRFSLGRTFCAVFLWRKKSTEMTDLGRFERALKQRNPPKSKAMVYPSCCAPTMSLQGSCQGCSAEGPGSEDPECPKVDPCRRLPLKLFGDFFSCQKSSPSSVHGWLCQCAKPEIALCSTRNSLSYPRTRNSLK